MTLTVAVHSAHFKRELSEQEAVSDSGERVSDLESAVADLKVFQRAADLDLLVLQLLQGELTAALLLQQLVHDVQGCHCALPARPLHGARVAVHRREAQRAHLLWKPAKFDRYRHILKVQV